MPPEPAPCADHSGSRKRDNTMDIDHGPSRSAKSRRIDCRCSPHLILPIMKLIAENDEQKGYVREIGFGSFLSMGELEMNKALNLWLVDKFNCDTEALDFEGGISVPIRPLVKSVLGIPSGPIQVVEGLDVDDALKDQYTVNNRAKYAKDVANEMPSIIDKEPFCIAFMMAMLGIYLAPNTSQTVNRAFLGAVKQVDKLKEMDWCNFVATYLFKGIREFKESNTACVTIKGCVHILSVIFTDFVKDAAFEVPVGFPRLGVVTKKHIKWVVSHPFTSLMVRRPEESVYAAVLDSIAKDNIVKDGKCVDSETNSLSDTPATTDTNQNNNKHRASGELGTVMLAKPAPCDNPSERKKGHNVMDTSNRPIRSAKSRTAEIIIYKCSPQLLPPIMKLITENVEQKGYVGEIGFGSFLSMAEFKMNRALSLWLVDKFNCDTEALEFEGGISIPVRPLVKSVLGIPSGPIQVVEGLYIDNALMDEYTCNGKVKNAWEVANGMCSITDKEPFCIAFMMGILGIYLAPSTSVGVNRKLLGAVRQVDKLKEMDWCNFVATYLFKGIKKFKKSKATFVSIKGCVHILSVIFIDFVKHAAFEVPVGFPRLGVVTTEHIKWVVSHPFTSLMVRRPEESIYAAVLDNWPKDNIVEDGKCVTNTDALSDTFGTTDSDQNKNRHPVSAELGTLPISTVLGPPVTSHNTTSWAIAENLEVGTSPRSPLLAAPGPFPEQIIFPTSGEQLQSSRPSSEPCSAQMHVSPDNPKGMNRGSTSPMENAGDWSAKKASVDRPSSGQAKRARGIAAVDFSVLNCTVCSCPLKRPVFQCIGRHLACGRCIAELPGEQCQICEHGSGFSPCPIMDDIVSSAMVECSHDGCKSSVPYHELDDHESACSHAPCYCTEAGCGFIGPPKLLLGHLAALHSMPVHTVNYGKVHRLLASKPRFLLHGEGDDSVFLLVVGTLGAAMVVSAVCIRAGASPSYAVKLWVNGPALPSRAAGRIKWKMEAMTSSTRPGEVAVQELPSFLTVPPAYLGWLGASKAVTLDIRIDRM